MDSSIPGQTGRRGTTGWPPTLAVANPDDHIEDHARLPGLIQAMLADSKAEIYAADCMVKDACARADRGENVIVEAAAAKMFASEMCGRVADRVVQIHGGAGYLKEYLAERFYRDVRIYRIYEGTTQILQLVIAKNMLREFAAGV